MSRIPALRKLPLILVGLFVVSSAYSAPLQSEVRDSQGHPLQNRPVWLLSKEGALIATVNTDANGIAHFPDVATGHYIVEIKGSNLAAIRKEVDIAGVATSTVSLVMDTAPENATDHRANAVPAAPATTTGVQSVIVTGVRSPTQQGALRDDIVKTESINAKEMEQTGATNLTDALTHRPGVDVQVECSICNVKSITLNNLPGRFTTLTLDGVPIFSPVSNAYGLDMVGVNGLERIDISRGAGTSLTTPESLSGTVNLVTKRPTKDAFEVDLSGGTYGYQRETIYGAKTFDGGAISINGTNQQHDSVDSQGYGISQFTGYDRDMGGFGLFLDDVGGFKIKTRYDHINEKRMGGPLGDDYSAVLADTTGNPFNFSAGPNGSPNPNSWINPSTGALLPPYDLGAAGLAQTVFTTRDQFVGTADRYFGETRLHIGFGYAQHEQNSWYGGDADYFDHQRQIYLDANLQRNLGGALVTAGFNYKFEDLHSNSISEDPSSPYFGIERSNVDAYLYRTPGLYVQAYEAFFNERLEVNASLREDHNNDFGDITTPRLNLLWHHSDSLASRIAMGTGYRLPTSFFEQDHGILSDNYVDRSQAKPERSINYSYALSYADDRFAVTGSVNHTRINDTALFVDDINNTGNFALVPAPSGFIVNNADIVGTWKATPGDAITVGLEGYGYIFNASDYYDAGFFSRPNFRGTINYEHEAGPWSFNLRSTYTGRQNLAKFYDYQDNPQYNLDGTPKPNWSPGFWVVDMHTSYQFNKTISAYFSVNNMFNYQQAAKDSYLLLDSQGNINVTHIWGPNIGRSLVVGLNLKF